jgi:hypothetical protein
MKTVLWIFLVILLGVIPAFAQSSVQIEVSAYGGVPIGSTLTSAPCCDTVSRFVRNDTDDARYLVGLSSGVVISDRLHVTFGATYMPVSFVQLASSPSAPQNPPTRRTSHGTSWDFPLLADYRWLKGRVRPFAGGGLIVLSRMTEGPNQAGAPVISGGVEWVHPSFAIRPEFRYTHFPEGSGSGVQVQRPTHQNQILIGFTFRTKIH